MYKIKRSWYLEIISKTSNNMHVIVNPILRRDCSAGFVRSADYRILRLQVIRLDNRYATYLWGGELVFDDTATS